MKRRGPQCIAIDRDGVRCRRRASKRMANLFVCSGRHGRIQILLIDDGLMPLTRSMLAHSRWRTAHEAQQRINSMYGLGGKRRVH